LVVFVATVLAADETLGHRIRHRAHGPR
jgi:hypothetical protein